jgi:hypothetical protein
VTSRRPLALLTALVLAAAGLSGCVAIKSESSSAPAPGVVRITLSVCASNRTSDTSTCFPSPTPTPGGVQSAPNTAEGDNGKDFLDVSQPGQLLLGLRIPTGTVAPESFRTPNGEQFDKSPTYTADLIRDQAPPAGLTWQGYISSSVSLQAGGALTSFDVDLALPPGAGGAPFAGPFPWRAVVGARPVNGDADAAVSCDTSTPSTCYDSSNLASTQPASTFSQVVSDFRVLSGTGTTAAPGQTATLAFPVRYSDKNGFGARTLRTAARSALPGSPAVTPAPASLPIAGNATPTVTAKVTVPAGTAPGSYPVTLTATDSVSGVARSSTATVTVVDKTAPTIRIGSPTDGEALTQRQVIAADYSCADEAGGSGPAACSGPVANGGALDTATPGQKTFTVTATDKAGNTATLTRTYAVSVVNVVSPAAALSQINVSVSFLFAASRKSTRFKTLEVKNVPKGATVAVTCAGKGCPTRKVKGKRRALAFTKRNASSTVALKPWVKKPLKVGTRLTISVTKPGSIGMVKGLTIRARKAPKTVTTCLPPGARKPAAC